MDWRATLVAAILLATPHAKEAAADSHLP